MESVCVFLMKSYERERFEKISQKLSRIYIHFDTNEKVFNFVIGSL